jgi:hypothetical protein
MREIAFVLPFALDSLNVRDRKHFAQRHRDQDRLRLEVIAALGGTRYLPRPAFARARITVIRQSPGSLDPDGLPATVKGLVDILCVSSAVHPHGLGVIEDDSARHIDLAVRQEQCARGSAATTVLVEELASLPIAETGKQKRKGKRGSSWRRRDRVPLRNAPLDQAEAFDAWLTGGAEDDRRE